MICFGSSWCILCFNPHNLATNPSRTPCILGLTLHAVDPRTLTSSTIKWRPNPSVMRVDAPSNSLPLVILPGFGNCARDYEEPNGPAEESMAAALRVSTDQTHTLSFKKEQHAWQWFSSDRDCHPTLVYMDREGLLHLRQLDPMCLGVSSDGYQLGKALLQNRGFKVYTVQVERRDWFQVGRSLLSRDYWSGRCTVDPGYRYIRLLLAVI